MKQVIERSVKAKDRLEHLDGLRGVAALIVVCVHGIIAFDFALYTGLVKDSIYRWDIYISGAPFLILMAGNFSVCVFFVLSGYVLSRAFSETKLLILPQVLKRYIRLALPILSVTLLSYLLLKFGLIKNHELMKFTKSEWLGFQFNHTPSLTSALQEGLYGALLFDSALYNSALWTMSIEFYGSLILMAVFWLGKNLAKSAEVQRQIWIALLVGIALLGYSSYFSLFAVGALLALLKYPRFSDRICLLLFVVGLFLGTIPYSAEPWRAVKPFVEFKLVAFFPISYPHNAITFFHSIGAILLVIVVDQWSLLRSALSSKIAKILGKISFPLYLVHIPILMSIVSSISINMLTADVPYGLVIFIGVVLLISLSIFASITLVPIIETPAVRLSGAISSMINDKMTAFYQKLLDRSNSCLLFKLFIR